MSETNNSNEVVVSIKNLQKAFGDNVVLRDIDLDVHKGEVVVVLGPSGSGKSTMLRCINRLEHPTSGSIIVEGVDVCAKGVDLNKVRTHLGMVFQQFNLFPHLSVKKNVMLAQQKVLKRSKEEAEKIAVEELTKVGLAERIDFMPSQLSGGQQQRVAIARALSMNPHVMLFDEATSALDPELVRDVLGRHARPGARRYDHDRRDARDGLCSRCRRPRRLYGRRRHCGRGYAERGLRPSQERTHQGVLGQHLVAALYE